MWYNMDNTWREDVMDRLRAGAEHLGLHLTDKQLDMFQVYYEDLVAWNKRFNLTAITEYEQAQTRHFVDSLSCLLAIRKSSPRRRERPLQCIDIGTGAGFPGLPLKIYCPAMHVMLLEATGKKVDFLQHMIGHLELENTQALKGRAEEVAHDTRPREQYDLVFARAVAELSVLAEYTLPFSRLGGTIIAQKGAHARQEAQSAEYAISILGGRVQRVIPIELLGLAEARNLVVIEKIARTPVKYPRRPGMPTKRPLKARTVNDSRDDQARH
jgi:16S rRNA (guanine527-N7)-methyltransferase